MPPISTAPSMIGAVRFAMDKTRISLELLDEKNYPQVRCIQREDVSEAYVDTVETILELTRYGEEHNCKGYTFAVKYGNGYIGVILLGEAFLWETDPEEMEKTPFYRLMGFVLDRRYRSMGIGGTVLEMVIAEVYRDFGVRPIALGVHRDNRRAAAFYLNHGFRATDAMEGNDRYYLRYPE